MKAFRSAYNGKWIVRKGDFFYTSPSIVGAIKNAMVNKHAKTYAQIQAIIKN